MDNVSIISQTSTKQLFNNKQLFCSLMYKDMTV